MNRFYLNGMLRALVFSLVGIFTPVYLYQLGSAFMGASKWGILIVAFYFIFTRITTLFCAIPISHIIEKIGFRKSIGVSLLLLTLNLGSLLFSSQNIWLVVVASISGGLNIPFYWVARSSAISQDSDKAKVGSQMGMMLTVEQVTTMLGPLAAGLIIEKWGFQNLYILALLVLFLSIIPLWGMPPHVHKNGASIGGFFDWLKNRRYSHIGIGIGARAVDDYSINILWPLTIFLMGIKTGTLGGIFTGVSMMALLIRLLSGKVFDKLHKRHDWSDEVVFAISACVNSMMWIMRIFISSLGAILAIDLSGAIFGTFYSSFYIDYELLGGKRMGSIAYWVYGEMMYSITAIGLFSLVSVGAWFNVWKEMFMILASLWVLISIVMARESNLK